MNVFLYKTLGKYFDSSELELCSFLLLTLIITFMLGNSSMDTHDGGSTASWLWASCQPIVGSIQYATKGILWLTFFFFFVFHVADSFMFFIIVATNPFEFIIVISQRENQIKLQKNLDNFASRERHEVLLLLFKQKIPKKGPCF